MVVTAQSTYNVGGVLLDRPFKVRRLGHVGFNATNLDACMHFYHDLLGFRVSDVIDHSKRVPPGTLDGAGDPLTYFMRYAGDHHSFVIGSKQVRDIVRPPSPNANPMVDIGQMSWQVDTLAEVVNAYHWLQDRGVHITRVGRDMPGSNWHTYFLDPEGHNNELYYGMEQIGWDGVTKPQPMYRDRFGVEPPLPQRSETQEIEDMRREGVNIADGNRDPEVGPFTHNVDGVLLPRPFRVVRIGPLGLFVNDVAAESEFYRRTMGFTLTETADVLGTPAQFLRAGSEHHSLALYSMGLKQKLGVTANSTCAVMGFQVGSYSQLRAAVDHLQREGVPVAETPTAFHTGIDYAAHFVDPDGRLVLLYHAMEQVDWNGNPRPAAQRTTTRLADWPEALADGIGAQAADVFQGPLG